jgi:hypothetical protein
MAYRIQLYRGDIKVADLASDRPLPDTRQDAVDACDLFNAEYALILDEDGQMVDRLKRSAQA